MKKIKLFAALLACSFAAGSAQAHLVAFGWKDNGNGSITMWGQHWHGDQTAPSTANGGVRIGVFGTDETLWPVFQWTGYQNNLGGTTVGMDAMVTAGIIDGWDTDANFSDDPSENDWFYTDPLVLGNGTWGLFTGTNCCIDTMTVPGQFTITGISSVPVGTGPGTVTNGVPAPGTLALLSLGLATFGFGRRKKV
ncbi:MAG: PEP-CTERM sorting domain-containing protein [Pseudomonadales bacterium]|nr:PEP-CTERM sorting domain-containing protein [Pseudomonadales bacterium]